jgi:glycosyltransferase involved in cell wall biosynthesis
MRRSTSGCCPGSHELISVIATASVIVPARNASATIARTLDALAAQDFGGSYEVIVVDDGSTDDTAALAERAPGNLTVLREPPRGPGPARNRGVEAAGGEILAFTDADCFPVPGWLRAGVDALERSDLVQGAVRPDPHAARGPFDHTISVTGETGLYETASMFVRRELFDRLDGFQDWLGARIGKPLAEDVWLGWRARRAGGRTAFSAEALVDHAVIPRSARGYVLERMRLVYFPRMARKIPELRRRLFYRRVFLTRRSAALDVALAGGLGAIAVALAWTLPAAGVPLLAAVPYVVMVFRRTGRAPKVALIEIAADLVGFIALAAGSLRSRTLLL